MKKSDYIKSMLLISALAMPLTGFTADADANKEIKDSPKTEIKDSVITSKVKAEYAKDKLVSAMHVKVNTDNGGVVKLDGTAKNQAEADKAVELAKGVKGVTSVQSNIQVKAE
jgi:hyperosmotically inducible periplasmic protein